jgi:hypothetical protein
MIFYLKQAVPAMPLKVLLDAQAWSALGPGSMTDEEFDNLLLPWWPFGAQD